MPQPPLTALALSQALPRASAATLRLNAGLLAGNAVQTAPAAPKARKRGQKRPSWEQGDPVFRAWLITQGLPVPAPEYRFHPARKWRFDYAWLGQKVALEVQGGVFSQGRHTRGASLLQEWIKLNTAAAMGWRIIYCQPSDLMTAQTAEFIRQALNFTP